MRLLARTSVVLLALVAGACGGDDRPGGVRGAEAQRAVERAMLTAEDLGPGWEQTGTSPPEQDDGTALDECLSDEVAAASDDPLAESDIHEFRRGDDPTRQQQLQISSAVLDDAEVAARLVAELTTADVRKCLADTFREEVAADAATDGVEVALGGFTADDGFTAAGDAAVRLRAPVELLAGGLTLPATVDIVVVHTGQVTSAVVAFALGEPIPTEDLVRWAEALAALQQR